ncbi:MAG: hypothetical protein M3P44_16205 [Actinomycetota bacterium]|nr:hypothetical protein [Actinomycetota bacterium]
MSPRDEAPLVPIDRVAGAARALRRQWSIVVVALGLALLGAFLMVSTAPRAYDASAKILLTNSQPIEAIQNITPSRSLDPERDLNTGVQLIRLDAIARPVRDQLRLPMSPAALLAEVSAAADGNSSVVSITARDASATRAAAIANAFAQQYLAFRRTTARGQYDDAVNAARAQLHGLSRRGRSGAEGVALRERIGQLRVAATLQTPGAELIERAVPPTSAATPQPRTAIAVAVVIGLLIGLIAAIAVDEARGRRANRPPPESPGDSVARVFSGVDTGPGRGDSVARVLSGVDADRASAASRVRSGAAGPD